MDHLHAKRHEMVGWRATHNRRYPLLLGRHINDPEWQRYNFRMFREATFEFIDEYTFKITFLSTYGNFPAQMTRWHQNSDHLLFPAHFMKQYHPKHADAADLTLKSLKLASKVGQQLANTWATWGTGSWYGPPGVRAISVNSA
jgi:hypothetical protein